LGLVEQTSRNWVKAAAAGKLNGAGSKVVSPEEMELFKLRAENSRFERENDILKTAPSACPALMNRNSSRVHWMLTETAAERFLEV
jgi:transposase-like protein